MINYIAPLVIIVSGIVTIIASGYVGEWLTVLWAGVSVGTSAVLIGHMKSNASLETQIAKLLSRRIKT